MKTYRIQKSSISLFFSPICPTPPRFSLAQSVRYAFRIFTESVAFLTSNLTFPQCCRGQWQNSSSQQSR